MVKGVRHPFGPDADNRSICRAATWYQQGWKTIWSGDAVMVFRSWLGWVLEYYEKPYCNCRNQPLVCLRIPAIAWNIIIENIGDIDNEDGPDGWKSVTGNDFVAKENDIVEWTGSTWAVIFNAAQSEDTLIYQTNIYTGVQYKWDGLSWTKSFEGEYREGGWRLRL